MTLEQLQTLSAGFDKVPTGTISLAERNTAINAALKEYSRRISRLLTAFYAGTGASEYALGTVVSGWNSAYVARAVRYPVGEESERELTRGQDWRDYEAASGFFLRFSATIPSSKTFGLEYYGPDYTVDTIQATDEEAVGWLVAHYVLQMAADKKAENANSTISADSVSQNEQSKAYAFQSKDAYATWDRHAKGRVRHHNERVTYETDKSYHRGQGPLSRRRQSRLRP